MFLLTALVGFISPLRAQIEPKDSSEVRIDSAGILQNDFSKDSSLVTSPSKKDSLSTDSVYTSTVKSDKGLFDYQVVYNAEDSILISPSTDVIELYNKAFVEYGEMKIEAGYIRINFSNNEMFASGLMDTTGNWEQKPLFTEKDKSYRADEMRYNFETKKARINKVITHEGEGFLHGETIKKTESGTFYVRNASYTTCSHEHPHFRIRTPKAKVIPGEKVVTQFAFLELLDVPTPLMVPFGFFPTTDKRKSGIIIPSYGNSQFRGYFLQQGGFYWAASDYWDLTLTGDIYTQGGYGLQAATDYRKRYKFSGSLSARYNLLRFGEPEFAPFIPNSFSNQSDFSITWSHRQDPKANPFFRFSANVNIASTQFNQIVEVNPDLVLQNRLNSSVSLARSWANKPFNLNVTLNHSQNNQTKDLTLTLPRINFAVNRFFPFRGGSSVGGKKKWYEEIGITYTADAQNQIQTRMDKPIFTETVFRDSSRMGMEHQFGINANYKVLKYFVFSPTVNFTERWYPNKLNFSYDSLSQSVITDTVTGFFANRSFRTAANLSTKLYGTWRYKGFVRAIRHVMTPNVGLSYTPDFSTDFWGYYQQVQSDSLGNTELRNSFQKGIYGSAGQGLQGNINFAIQNTLEAKVRSKTDSTGLKKIKLLDGFNLNGSYNAAAEEFQWSAIRLTARSTAFDNMLSLNYQTSFDLYGERDGQRVNEFAWDVNDRLFRVTQQRFTVGLNLNANRFKKKKEDQGQQNKKDRAQNETVQEQLGVTSGDPDYYRLSGFVDFNVPWSVNLGYNLNQTNNPGQPPRVNQSVDLNGDLDLSKGWKVGFRTGYDLEAQDFTYTTFDFYRDLHCWELRCTWVPFGFQQSYVITIRVKSTVLQDLKLERRRGIGDFQR